MGHRGLMIDALQSVRLVAADGSLVTASKKENPDLFWGIRGAGSNFGVVISATFKVWDITNNGQAMSAGLVFPASVNGSYWRTLQNLDNNMPSRLALTNMAFFDRETHQVRMKRPNLNLRLILIPSRTLFSMLYTSGPERMASHT